MAALKAGRSDAAAVHGESQCPHFFFRSKKCVYCYAHFGLCTYVCLCVCSSTHAWGMRARMRYTVARACVEHVLFSPGLGFRKPRVADTLCSLTLLLLRIELVPHR